VQSSNVYLHSALGFPRSTGRLNCHSPVLHARIDWGSRLFGLFVYSSARTEARLRRTSRTPTTDSNDMRARLFAPSNRLGNLRQLHALLFLLFGVCCVNEVVAILRGIQYASLSLSAARMEVFERVTFLRSLCSRCSWCYISFSWQLERVGGLE
jgi:hypothetical protein